MNKETGKIDETIARPSKKQISYCASLCFDTGLSYSISLKRIKNLTKRECSILINKLLHGAGMMDVFDFWDKTSAEALASGPELLAEDGRLKH